MFTQNGLTTTVRLQSINFTLCLYVTKLKFQLKQGLMSVASFYELVVVKLQII